MPRTLIYNLIRGVRCISRLLIRYDVSYLITNFNVQESSLFILSSFINTLSFILSCHKPDLNLFEIRHCFKPKHGVEKSLSGWQKDSIKELCAYAWRDASLHVHAHILSIPTMHPFWISNIFWYGVMICMKKRPLSEEKRLEFYPQFMGVR